MEWEFFLHKVFNGSFAEFKEGMKNDKMNKGMARDTMQAIVNESASILNNFNPERGE